MPVEAVHVHEERVVALYGRQPRHRHAASGTGEDTGDLPLLVDREQEVGLDADHERPLRADPAQARLHRAPVLGDVEEVHGARKIEVAVRVEGARELLGVHLEVGLDLELGAEHLRRPRP